MADPVGDIIGDYRAFAAQQRDRLLARGIDIRPYPLSHLAVRVPEWDQYVHLRTLLERHATANLENVWNGRPISKILLATPLEVLDGMPVPLIELIPPVHQRVYKMGLEHLGVVIGDEVDAFSREHRAALTGQTFQSAYPSLSTRCSAARSSGCPRTAMGGLTLRPTPGWRASEGSCDWSIRPNSPRRLPGDKAVERDRPRCSSRRTLQPASRAHWSRRTGPEPSPQRSAT